MGFVKCPRCELNYILDGGQLCTVCRKEVRGEDEVEDIAELCSECGENPVAPGNELCAACLKEMARRIAEPTDDVVPSEDPTLEIDSVATMDEIAIDIDDPLESEEFEQDDDFSGEEDEEDMDEADDDDLLDR